MLLVEGFVKFFEVVVVRLVHAEVKRVGAEGEVRRELGGGVLLGAHFLYILL